MKTAEELFEDVFGKVRMNGVFEQQLGGDSHRLGDVWILSQDGGYSHSVGCAAKGLSAYRGCSDYSDNPVKFSDGNFEALQAVAEMIGVEL